MLPFPAPEEATGREGNPMSASSPPITPIPAWRRDILLGVSEGIRAGRANLLPGIVIWMIAGGILVGYYNVAPVHDFLERIADVKLRFGFFFSLVSTSIFGGLIPFLIEYLQPANKGRVLLPHLFILMAFWGYKGMEIDLLYRLQAMYLGEGQELGRIALKVFLDQFVYCPIIAVPPMLLVYHWKDQIGRPQKNFRLEKGFWRKRVPAVLLSNWGVWIPTVALLYCLPLALQLPIQNLVLTLYMLIFSLICRGAGGG